MSRNCGRLQIFHGKMKINVNDVKMKIPIKTCCEHERPRALQILRSVYLYFVVNCLRIGKNTLLYLRKHKFWAGGFSYLFLFSILLWIQLAHVSREQRKNLFVCVTESTGKNLVGVEKKKAKSSFLLENPSDKVPFTFWKSIFH